MTDFAYEVKKNTTDPLNDPLTDKTSEIGERLVDTNAGPEEIQLEVTLRPEFLHEFVGQEHIKLPLTISLEAAKGRGEPLEHVLLYGNPGLGKTTLAHIIAREMGGLIRVTSGPALEKVGDLAAILTNLKNGDILFIDEIHRLGKTIEEMLYSAMEDYALDIILGKGPSARTLRLPLSRFTLIGATTKLNLLSSPLRDRFGHVCHLNFYEENEINSIITRNARLLKLIIDADSTRLISTRARRTPRVANRLLKRVRDYAQVKHNGILDVNITREALDMLQVDSEGLDEVDRKILTTIIDKFHGGPVGLGTLAAAVAEEIETIEQIYEPYLLQLGLLERTPRGRTATRMAYEHFERKYTGQDGLL